MKPHLVFLVLGGCGGLFGGGGGDDEPIVDAGPSGLTLIWESRPEKIPDEPGQSPRVLSATFNASNVRVVGDAGPVTAGALVLAWAAETQPSDLRFADAPSGLYSRCLFDLVPPTGGYAYEITGTVTLNSTPTPFVIRDRGTTPITINFSEMLAPGGEATVRVRVRIADLVSAVDFSQVMPQNGTLVVEDGSPQLANVRNELADTFDTDD